MGYIKWHPKWQQRAFVFIQSTASKNAAARLDLGWMIRCSVRAFGFSYFKKYLYLPARYPFTHSSGMWNRNVRPKLGSFWLPSLKKEKKKVRERGIVPFQPTNLFSTIGNSFLVSFLLNFIVSSSAFAFKDPGQDDPTPSGADGFRCKCQTILYLKSA